MNKLVHISFLSDNDGSVTMPPIAALSPYFPDCRIELFEAISDLEAYLEGNSTDLLIFLKKSTDTPLSIQESQFLKKNELKHFIIDNLQHSNSLRHCTYDFHSKSDLDSSYFLPYLKLVLESVASRLEDSIIEDSLADANVYASEVMLELEDSRDRALDALRNKSIFLTKLNHALRTPLNGIMGFSQLLMSEFYGTLTEKQLEFAKEILASGEDLNARIAELLDVSKIDIPSLELQSEKVFVDEIISQAHSIHYQEIEVKGLIYTQLLEPNLVILGDFYKSRRIIINIISNAIKYTPRGGTLTIQASRHGSELVEFSIQDTGCGIPAEDQDRIFDDFVRDESSHKQATPSAGVGLSVARRLVELQGGTISVESEVGEGSVFIVRLPIYRMPQDSEFGEIHLDTIENANQTANTGIHQELRGLNILLVEDNETNQLVAIEILREVEVNVWVANDGVEGVEKAKSGDYDMILMDCKMPNMDGFDASRAIREDTRLDSTPIIGLTGSITEEDRKKCLDVGMNDHIEKPIRAKILFETMKKWCDFKRSKLPLR